MLIRALCELQGPVSVTTGQFRFLSRGVKLLERIIARELQQEEPVVSVAPQQAL